jgi:hypothetical protein
MDLKKNIMIFVFAGLIAITTLVVFAAEETTVSTENPVASSPVATTEAPVSTPQQAPAQNENDTQWTWGEVVSLDSAAKTVTLKYLDYETDQEKNIVLAIDEKTTFENIKSFDEIKVKDTLSIDYTVAPDGKNIAKNIGLESPDSSSAVPAKVAEEVKPADTQAAPSQPATSPEAAVEQTLPVKQTSDPVTQK